MALPLVLKPLVESVKALYEMPNQQWIQESLDHNDLETLKKEALEQSPFDPLKLRETLWSKVVSGEAKIVTKSCINAKVIYIQEKRVEPPWELWGRLFQWLGATSSGKRWRVFWFPAPNKRSIPEGEVGPEHINGGYTFPCNSDSIVVYRLEEATRVLVHELLHAACLDPPATLPLKEATTETWAELFLVALCSGGSMNKAAELWTIQSQWISNQNEKLKKKGVERPEHYAWRYTVGRELILRSLKIELPEPKASRTHSCRLTSPALCM